MDNIVIRTNKEKRSDLYVDYIRKMTNLILMRRPDLDKDDVVRYVRGILDKVSNDDAYRIDILESDTSVNIEVFDKTFINEDLVLTGSGSLYEKQKNSENIIIDLIQYFMKERKVYKDQMFVNLNNPDEYDRYNMLQQTIKILNNSLYGVLTQRNSIFYNKYSGPAITYTGEDIVTTSASAFENFLSSNVTLKNMDDVMTYIYNIINEEYNDYDIQFNKEITNEMLYDRLTSFFVIDKSYNPTSYEKNFLKEVISNMNDSQKIAVYYKNNIYEFLDDTSFSDDHMKQLFGRTDFISPGDPPEEIEEDLEKMWSILKQYVLYNYHDFYRMQKIDGEKRKSVLTIDTDSNFVYVDPLYNYFAERYPDIIDTNNNALRISTIAVIAYNLEHLLSSVFAKLSDHLGMQDDYYESYYMKNELLVGRLMLTPAKKQYGLTVIQKEGNMYDEPQMDIKGLSIRKVNTNPIVRQKYSDILQNDILFKEGPINISGIIKKYKLLEDEIKESLKEGKSQFLLPGKVNKAESYKDPYAILPFKATMIWNILYPNREINTPNKINTIRVEIKNMDHVYEHITDEVLLSKFEEVFSNEKLLNAAGEITAIAIPEDFKDIPEELINFINIESMIDLNTRAGIPILEALGFVPLTTTKYQLSTNIIKF